jgi:hypothetical protein
MLGLGTVSFSDDLRRVADVLMTLTESFIRVL